jgi:uncharacterized protein
VRTASCIYVGTIRHRRREPRRSFEHRIALFYLDLDELPGLLGGRLVARRPGTLRFRRRDYLGPDSLPLDWSVRERVEAAIGERPVGPIRVLTQLRSFGHAFNPVSFYYCFDRGGDQVQALVAEVTNTPWGERHAYVLEAGGPGAVTLSGTSRKALHVSPFMAMDHRYVVRAEAPGERLAVHIESWRADVATFDATLAMRRSELTRRSAARVTCRYPLASARVLALIYGHAVGLKLAGATVYPHPGSGPRPHQLTGQEAR